MLFFAKMVPSARSNATSDSVIRLRADLGHAGGGQLRLRLQHEKRRGRARLKFLLFRVERFLGETRGRARGFDALQIGFHVADRVIHRHNDVLLEGLEAEQQLIGVQFRHVIVGARLAVAQRHRDNDANVPEWAPGAGQVVAKAIEVVTQAVQIVRAGQIHFRPELVAVELNGDVL